MTTETPPPSEEHLPEHLRGLNPRQREAVEAVEGPLLILAGAGSGKTRVLTRRVAHLLHEGVLPWRILAVTFTNKAAAEMKERVAELVGDAGRDVWVSTFHSACVRILRREAQALGYSTRFVIYDTDDQHRLLKDILVQLKIDPKSHPPRGFRSEIDRAKNRLMDPLEVEDMASRGHFRHHTAQVYAAYQRRMKAAQAVDFNDLINLVVQLFTEHPDVLEKYQDRFRYLLIDEYQDTNHAQYQLVRLLSAKHRNIAVVGDDDQCVDVNALIDTPRGPVKADSLRRGDRVLSYRNGTVKAQVIRHIARSSWTWGFQIATGSGKHLLMSPNHRLWATTPTTAGEQHVVYLMYRRDMGFRLGVTNKGKKDRNKPWNTFGNRCYHEKADRFWILEIAENREAALLLEQQLSLRYSVPTSVFSASSRGLSQDRVDGIFEEFGRNGARILEEHHLSFDHPHWMGQSFTKHGWEKHTINLVAHSSSNSQVALEWTGDKWDRVLSEVQGVHTAPGDRRCLRRYFASYREALAFANRISSLTGARVSHRLSTPEGMLREITASGLFVGMRVPVRDGDTIKLDPIVSVERVEGSFLDLDVDDASNFFAGEILTHNSIYSFRGADIRNILDFERDFPEARVVVLDQNYRSTERILKAATAVVSHNDARKEKELWTDAGTGEALRRIIASNEEDEATRVVNEIKRLIQQDRRPGDIAIIYRTNARSRLFEMALGHRRVPYVIVGARKFYERREIRDMLGYLKLVVNPADEMGFVRVVNVPKRGIGAKTVERLRQQAAAADTSLLEAARAASLKGGRGAKALGDFVALIDRARDALPRLSPGDLVHQLAEESGYLAMLRAEDTRESQDRLSNIEALCQDVAGLSAEGDPVEVLQEWMDRASLTGQDEDLPDDGDRGAVTLLTAHLAKGLEFPVVFVVGMVEGAFPHSRSAEQEEDLAEERRLVYVAFTRAMQRLYVSHHAARRSWNGFMESVRPSRFLGDVPRDLFHRDAPFFRKGKKGTSRDFTQARERLEAFTQRHAQASLFSPASAPEPDDEGGEDSGEVRYTYVPDTPEEYKVGMTVAHPQLGDGQILQRAGTLHNLRLIVRFKRHGRKTVFPRHVPLEIVEA